LLKSNLHGFGYPNSSITERPVHKPLNSVTPGKLKNELPIDRLKGQLP
jgi:hypothetical protein